MVTPDADPGNLVGNGLFPLTSITIFFTTKVAVLSGGSGDGPGGACGPLSPCGPVAPVVDLDMTMMIDIHIFLEHRNVGQMVMMLALLTNMIKIEHKNVMIFQGINTMHHGNMDVKLQD